MQVAAPEPAHSLCGASTVWASDARLLPTFNVSQRHWMILSPHRDQRWANGIPARNRAAVRISRQLMLASSRGRLGGTLFFNVAHTGCVRAVDHHRVSSIIVYPTWRDQGGVTARRSIDRPTGVSGDGSTSGRFVDS